MPLLGLLFERVNQELIWLIIKFLNQQFFRISIEYLIMGFGEILSGGI